TCLRNSQYTDRKRYCRCGGAQQSRHHGSQIKTAVEAIGEFCKIALCILGVIECMVGSVEGSLEIARKRIGPTKLGTLHSKFATSHNVARMLRGRICNSPEHPKLSDTTRAVDDRHTADHCLSASYVKPATGVKRIYSGFPSLFVLPLQVASFLQGR